MVDIATDASVKPASHPKPLRVGLDIGSTTVKAVVLDQSDSLGDTLFSDYRRHHANVRATVAGLLVDIHKKLVDLGRGDEPIRLSITGSGGLALADNLHVPFIQEVIAETEAIDKEYPQADVIIELGGEDAKITYLKPTPEQRMNGSCAGGTGAFIDQMSTLLDTDAAGLNEMAKSYENLYPIASRCGVFAKTDLQPLINDGAAKPDLAASIFTAVATQTIAGLASGRPIHGTVIFLGGPLFFMSELRAAFQRALEGKVDEFIVPTDAHLYVAYGSALQADTDSDDQGHHFEAYTCDEILKRLDELKNLPSNTPTMPPLFPTEVDREDFNKRHHKEHIHIGTLEGAHGPHFLGIDAGSTTIKATLVNDDREIVWSSYANNEGSPLTAAINIVKKIQSELPEGAWIARSCATGYGEGLITTGLHLDEGVVETMAHYRGAEMVSPGVTAVIDIGGQDMKYLAITDGVIDSIAVNEACSSGCGSFLQTFAMSMGLTIQEFTQKALASTHPVDLGSRCTVFMNSSVKQAQKEGASIEDIAAGLCYSVVRNALYKVIKLRDSGELGDTVVVQGGTFLNDAVLRAFELLTERQVTRPNIAGLMGAFGAALTARMHYQDEADHLDVVVKADGSEEQSEAEPAPKSGPKAAAFKKTEPAKPEVHVVVVDGVAHTASSILTGEALDNMSMTTERDVCKLCQNHCKLTITTFSDGSRFVTGNRCERGGDAKKKRSDRPNLYDYKYKRCFAYRRLTDKAATRGEIGIPRALNMYENYPFWFTLLTTLGFKVMISGRSSHELFETGIESIASENICYPAKLVHGHIKWLLDKGVKTIFYPCVSYEENLVPNTDNHYNCPVVANYPLVVGANMPELREDGVRYMHPYFNLANHELMVDRILEEFAWADVTREEVETAVKAAYAEDKVFKHDVQQEGLTALAYMKEHNCRGIVLAGRPYHIDPEINHGIPETICSLGMVVLSEDSICELQPGEKLNLTDFLSEGEEDPRKKNANGFRHVDDRKVTVNRMPLRVTNQWAYHSRLYAAAHFVASYPGLELVQLNSFGCGLDAVTTDEVCELLEQGGKLYTCLKIDEVNNLGAVRIRIRSLLAAVAMRRERGIHSTSHVQPFERVYYTKEMQKQHYTILAPQMSPIHFDILEPIFRHHGYNFEVLQNDDRAAIDAGLKYVNNDACYPSITAVGQLMEAVTSGRYDTDHLALIMSQTGGCCRASNYIAFIRRALKKAGLEHIPVISLNANGMETNEGFRISPSLLLDAAHGIVLGDLLMRCLYRVRPYELEKGSANALHRKWRDICIDSLTSEHPKYRYAQLCRGIVEDFDALPIDETLKKPRVGVVGEILVKYMPLANNHVVDLLEREGAEAVVPDLLDFFAATIYEQDFKHTHLGKGWTASATAKLGIPALQRMRRPAIEALKASKRFDPPMAINHVAELAKPFLSIGNQYGEGWFLAGEMAELITSGTPNIVCIQPFACLPNHVVGKGVIKALRAAYPGANIVAVDYDPGASEVNQLNRIKLMLTAAQRALHAQEATPKKPQPPEAPSISLPHPKVAML